MPLKVFVIPDKFKGTLTASQAAQAIANGWRTVRPRDRLELLPMCDGGDGFGEVMAGLLSAETQVSRTLDAAHRPISAKWWWVEKQRLAIIESAELIGLAKLKSPKSNAQSPKTIRPFDLDTFGLGQLLRVAAEKGTRRCMVGIGGSATNDGGFGMARALGWRFLNREGSLIERWTELKDLVEICAPANEKGARTASSARKTRLSQKSRGRPVRAAIPQLTLSLPWFEELIVAVDVKNPLLGPNGATRIYGPQKGFRASDFRLAEACLGRLAAIVQSPRSKVQSPPPSPAACRRTEALQAPSDPRQWSVVSGLPHRSAAEAGRWSHVNDKMKDKVALAEVPGSGAAGGLGFGLMAFAGARLEKGFELFARHANLEKRLQGADLVITGEGAVDRSTFMGKGVGEVARRCAESRIPCIGLAGSRQELTEETAARFALLASLEEITTEKEARAKAGFWLTRLAEKAAREWRERRESDQ